MLIIQVLSEKNTVYYTIVSDALTALNTKVSTAIMNMKVM